MTILQLNLPFLASGQDRLLQWTVRQFSEVENYMVSVERIIEYTHLESEAPEYTKVLPPLDWPSKGDILIKNLSVQYTGTNAKQLENLSVHILPGEKVGICGRTGAGVSQGFNFQFSLS